MTDEEIIEIRKLVRPADYSAPWADSVAFARAILRAANPQRDELRGYRLHGGFKDWKR